MTNKPALLLLLFLCGCALPQVAPESYLLSQKITPPNQSTFQHCYNYGCARIVNVSFSPTDWESIEQEFEPTAQNSIDERIDISNAIAIFEQIVGEKTGTKVDKFGTFRNMGNLHHDCIDESTNTTIYLILLQQRGLLKFHTALVPDTRLPLIHGVWWPHRTAVIREKKSTQSFAVDSWFHDSGFPAEVISMTLWKKGWKPEENFTLSSD